METLPRRVVLPIVIGVWGLSALVGVYTAVLIPWFTEYYMNYKPGAFLHTTFFISSYPYYCPAAAMVAIIIGVYGFIILRRTDQKRENVAWFMSVSLMLAGAWLVWTMAVERSFYLLSLPF